MAVSEMNDIGHDVFFTRSDRGIKAYAYHEGSGTKVEVERVNGVFELPVELVPYKSEYFEEQHIRYVFFTFGAATDRGHDGQDCDSRQPKLTRACSAEHPTEGGALLESLVIGGSSAIRDVIYPSLGGGLLGERDQWSKEGERGQNETNCSVKWKVMQLQGQL